MNGENRGDFIQTISGIKFYPLDPRPEEIFIHDIAYSLSTKVRYNGHVKEYLHYSIAEHSVILANHILDYASAHRMKLMSNEQKRMLRLWCLLHDAAEAYIPDMPKPIKRMPELKGFVKIEKNIMHHIAMKYNLDPITEPQIVTMADTAILADEKRECMAHQIQWNALDLIEKPLKAQLHFWEPKEAYKQFMDLFCELMCGDKDERCNCEFQHTT